ncbi:MAG: hypothetical protein ACRD38_01325 [Nitrososphaerales archaeon]
MTATETIDLTINATEVRSVNDVASIIANTLQQFADKHGVKDQYDQERMEQDMIFFLVKRNDVNLTRLRAYILEDGSVAVGNVSGRRKAELLINIQYLGGKGYL